MIYWHHVTILEVILKIQGSKTLFLIALMVIALSQIMCDIDSVIEEINPTVNMSNEDKDKYSHLENIVFQVKTDSVKIDECTGYSPQEHLLEAYEIRQNSLVVKINSEEIIYKWRGNGIFCHEPQKGFRECIQDLSGNGYRLFVEEENKGEHTKTCYSAIKLISTTGQFSSVEEIDDQVADENTIPENEQPEAPQPEAPPEPEAESPGEEAADDPPTSEEDSESTSPLIFHDWYGPACEEMEGTFPYFWEVHLVENPETDGVNGTIKFHNCPGGGRVLYTVSGSQNEEGLFLLQGTKKTGGGALYNDSADVRTYTFDPASGSFIE